MLRRWTFADPDGVLDTLKVRMNPTQMDAPELVETPVLGNATPAGRLIDIPQAVKGQQMTWQGTWRTLADEDAFAVFVDNARPVLVTDHYGRKIRVLLNTCDAIRAESANWPERQKFTVHATVLEVTQA